ncbi:MAG: M16 family metallopeptidase [Thermodesulfobacteriota bacterium]
MHTAEKRTTFSPLIFILFIIAIACPAFALSPALAGSAPADSAATAIFNPVKQLAQQTSDPKPDPDAEFGSLENGMRYILMPNAKPEDRVSMHLYVQAGAMHEKADERGIAHYLEHMLFNGTEHFDPGELVKYFQAIGMRFGPDVNARTGFYSTVYDIDLPVGDKQSLDEGLLVLRDYAAGALIPEKEVEKERSVILAEKRTRDSVSYRTFVETLRFELPEALISRRMPIGTKKVIRAADRELLKSFYDAWYRPERMLLVLVGDLELKQAEKLITSKFADLKARAPARGYPDAGKIAHSGIKSFHHYESEAGSTTVSIETLRKQPQPADSRELRRKRLYSQMASRIINNRLDELRNQPDTPFNQASIHADNYLHYVQAAEIRADCPPDKWQENLRLIEQNLRKALKFGFTQSEVEQVKKERRARLERAVKSTATRESGQLAREIINSLDTRRVFQSPKQEKDLLAPMIAAATPEILHQALKADWAPDNRLLLVTGNAELSGADTPAEEQIGKVFKQSRKTPVKAPEEKALQEFPYLDAPSGKSRIKDKETIGDQGIVRVAFENNVHLNIKKTDFKANKVSAALAFGRGENAEPADHPGLSRLAEQVVSLSALGEMDRDALKQALAGSNTRVQFKVEEDKFVFSGDSVSDEIPLLFQLFYAHLMDPGFRSDAYDLAMRQFRQRYKSWRHSIHGTLLLEGRRFLAGGDSRFGMPDWNRFEQNTLSDVREWLGTAMAEAPLEISVVGDLDVDAVIRAASTWFGPIKKRTAADENLTAERGPDFPSGRSRRLAVPTKIEKGLVEVAYPTDDFWDIHKTRRLSVLSEVMADRMRIKIREKMGAAYSYHTYNNPSRAYPGYGVFHVMVEIAPGDSQAVIDAVETIAANLADKGVSRDERDRAIKPVLTSIRERVKTNSYWLDSVLKGASRHPQQLEWSRSFLSDYQSITAAELSRLAKQYLDNPAAARLIITPAARKGQEGKKGS